MTDPVCNASDQPMLDGLMLNPLLQVQAFDDGAERPRVLLELPDENGRFYRLTLPKQLQTWLRCFDGERSLQTVCQRVRALDPSADEQALKQFSQLIDRVLLPNRVLVYPDGEFHAQARKAKPHWMLFQLRLLGAGMVNPVAAYLQALYRPAVVWLMVAVALLGQLVFVRSLAQFAPGDMTQIDSVYLLTALALFLFGLCLHEFGHAAAAYRYGCRRTELGIGWYLIFPIFYADMSEAWRCSRRQRAVIDLGGMYFQALFIGVLMLAHAISPHPVWFFTALLLNLSLLINLNPFLRMDGYWLVSDWLGIPNLRRATAMAVRARWARLFGRQAAPSDAAITARHGNALLIYALLSNLFFAWVLYLVSTRLIWRVLENIPQYYAQLGTALRFQGSFADILVALLALAWQFLLLAMIAYLCFSLLRLLWRRIRPRRKVVS